MSHISDYYYYYYYYYYYTPRGYSLPLKSLESLSGEAFKPIHIGQRLAVRGELGTRDI
jgi:hypothetical protein